jgi:hypothetical protein
MIEYQIKQMYDNIVRNITRIKMIEIGDLPDHDPERSFTKERDGTARFTSEFLDIYNKYWSTIIELEMRKWEERLDMWMVRLNNIFKNTKMEKKEKNSAYINLQSEISESFQTQTTVPIFLELMT